MDVNYEEALQERVQYLRALVNSLILQNLSCGNIPKVKPGTTMQVDKLLILKNELENTLANSENTNSTIT